jgi:hypothetical protein
MTINFDKPTRFITPGHFSPITVKDKQISNFLLRGIKDKVSYITISCEHCQNHFSEGVFLEDRDTKNIYFIALRCLKNIKIKSEEKKFSAIYRILKGIDDGKKETSSESLKFLIENEVIPNDVTEESLLKYISINLIFTSLDKLYDKFGDKIKLEFKHHKKERPKKTNLELFYAESLKKQKIINEAYDNLNNNTDETQDCIELLEVRTSTFPKSNQTVTNPFTISTEMEQGVRLAQPNAYNITKYSYNP